MVLFASGEFIPRIAALVAAEGPQPVFHLSFDKGLAPDAGPEGQCKWSGKAPPVFYERGLMGKALIVTDDAATAGFVSVPKQITDKIAESGTLFFWLRGLDNWNIWSIGEGAQGGTFLGLGAGMVYKWTWYGEFALFGHGPTLFYPRFDQYEWTQLGVSWQSEGEGKTRNRIYLNGKLAGETTGTLSVGGLRLGSYPLLKGGRLLIDDLKLYDRVLTESEIKRQYRLDGGWINLPVVSAPRLKSAPKIDGKISADEWSSAARVTGMLDATTGENAVDQSAFYIGYDDANLYIAMMGDMTERARKDPAAVIETFLRTKASGRSEKVKNDDAVEIILSPDYWQAGDHNEPGTWKEYRLLANAVGAYSASSYGPEGAEAKWNVEWKSASTVSGNGWQFEAGIPFASLGGAPAPGARWALQLGRFWKHLKKEYDVWCWGRRARVDYEHMDLSDDARSERRSAPRGKGAPPVPEQPDGIQALHLHKHTGIPLSNLGVIRFEAEEGVAVRVDGTGGLSDKKMDFHAELSNTAAAEQKVKVKLHADTDEISHEETLTLPADGKMTFAKSHVITDFAASRLTFGVYDAKDKLIHRTAVPFHIEQKFGVWVAQFPNYEKFVIDLDLGTMSKVPVDELKVDVRMADASGKSVYSATDRGVSSYVARMEYSTAGFDLGDYTLSVVIRRGKKTLAKEERDFNKIEKAPWFDNRYGLSDMDNDVVPYPWTNMEVEEGTIRVWGREYRFVNRLLPEQITTLDYPILRAPMRLVIKTADGHTLDTSSGPAESTWIKTDRTRVEGRRMMQLRTTPKVVKDRLVEADVITLTNSFWAEYDGLVWCTLKIEPKKKIALASMELEMQLTEQFTDVMKGFHIGKLKPEGVSGPPYLVWLGNGEGGIQWIPGGGDFFVKDKKKTMHVDVAPTGATLHIVMMDVPTELDAPYEIQFGLNATPLRPKITRLPFFRERSLIGGGPFYPKGLESLPAADPGHDVYGGGSKAGRLYVWTATASVAVDASGTEDFKKYGAEWMADPFQRPRKGWETELISPTGTKSYIDYFVWRHWRYQQKYGYGGLYYDNPNFSTLENRQILKRLYNITLSNQHLAAREQAIGIASNGIYNMAFGGFMCYQWNGEHLNSTINSKQPTYLGVIDPAVYRAEYMGHNWAWPVMFLGQARINADWVEGAGGAEAVIDQFQGLELLHDNRPSGWHIRSAMDQVCKRAQDAYKKHNMSHWIYQFTPYWHQDIVTLPDKDVHASFYIARPSVLAATRSLDHMGYPYGHRAKTFYHYFEKRMPKFEYLPTYIRAMNYYETEDARKDFSRMRDKVVMIVYNNTEREGVMRLKPDWKQIGLGEPESLSVENAVHSTGFRLEKAKDKNGKEIEKPVFFERPEEYAKIENGEIVFPMTKFNYRMIVLKRKSSP
jgi:hypothetical protein